MWRETEIIIIIIIMYLATCLFTETFIAYTILQEQKNLLIVYVLKTFKKNP